MICKHRETKTDGTDVAYYRDGSKWVGVFSWNRGGCLCATTVIFRDLSDGRNKEISTTGCVTDNLGDTNNYYAQLWEKHLG